MPSFYTPTRLIVRAALAGASLIVAAPEARADAPAAAHAHAYGIIVGSNAGGAGQVPLRYAEDDAERVAAVLRDLGRFGTTELRVLTRPDAAKILAAVGELVPKLKAHADRGEQATFFFYYSGHAKASALTLGDSELPLGLLRERLRQVPSTLTLVVLDACQSGAFARTKGAEPAADFSFNSVARLTTKGIAVMASSTGQELSQESDALKSSYFTHHLVVGLRGAGDQDGDGKVSLDEAYRYAYRRTLAATARTRVGTQHATLETDLSGQGDVPVTYPADAGAHLELAAPLDARVLVQQHASASVAAELVKVPGAPLRLALPAGAYDVTVRVHGEVRACALALADGQTTALDFGACPVAASSGAPKGWDDGPPEDFAPSPAERDARAGAAAAETRERDRWGVEGTLGFIGRADDAYDGRLRDFGYTRRADLVDLPSARVSLGATRLFAPHLTLVVQGQSLAGNVFARNVGTTTDTMTYKGWGAGVYLRVHADVVPRVMQLYGQAGGGASLAFTWLETHDERGPLTAKDTQWGYLLGVAGGVLLAPGARVGVLAQASYDRAPAMRNLLGDTHDTGGFAVSLGVRLRLGEVSR